MENCHHHEGHEHQGHEDHEGHSEIGVSESYLRRFFIVTGLFCTLIGVE